MKQRRLLFVLLLAVLLIATVFLQVYAQQDGDGRKDATQGEKTRTMALGEELFRLDVGAITGHQLLVGVEYADGHYFITSGGQESTTDTNTLFKLAEDGTIVDSWAQGTNTPWGWRDMAYDGTYLYASDSAVIDQIDPATGQATGFTIPIPLSLGRGLAYDPANDHFWVTDYFEDIYEVDRSGTVISSFSTGLYIYGLAWDTWSAGGPYLWTWSKDGSPWVYATQIDPTTGAPTGVGFQGSNTDNNNDEAAGATIAAGLVEDKLVLVAMHQATSDTLVVYDLLAPPVEPPAWGQVDLCIPAEEAPFAYVNQPWDFVEGAVAAGETVHATLKRNGSSISSATTTAGADGWFSTDFRNGGQHVDITANDVIELSGGMNSAITVVDIQGLIDVASDGVAGQVTGGDFVGWGVVCVRQPSDLNFVSKEVYFDAGGRFDVRFTGIEDIEYDYVAQVVYPDNNGNYVVQLFNPEGLDLRVLMTDNLVEGVTTPGAEVTVTVWDGQGPKGSTATTADETGFYSTAVFDNGQKVDLVLGDHVGVTNGGHSRETFLTMSHVTYLQTWNNRALGTVYGVTLPAEGTQGRVDLWSAAQKQWFTLYTWIETNGQFGADFNGIVDMTPADRLRLWVRLPDGTQQASIGATLDLGVSTSQDRVWGYTAAESIVEINLYRGHDANDNLLDLIGTAAVRADASGYYSTTLNGNGGLVDIAPSNVIQVIAAEHIKTFFVGQLEARGDVETDMLTIFGPAEAVVQVLGYRPVAGSRAVSVFVQLEISIGADGQVTVDLSQVDLRDGDIFDVTAYVVEQGNILHRTMVAPTFEDIYLPMVIKKAGS